MKIAFRVNGQLVEVETHAKNRLLDVLRDDLGLIGTKESCGKGECGACSILMNGKCVNSCLIPALQLSGSRITTIEGMSQLPFFAEIEQTFLEHGAVQCGFCIPGFVMSTVAFLNESSPDPSLESIKLGLAGNLCRCTGYDKILNAIHDLSRRADLSASIRRAFSDENR